MIEHRVSNAPSATPVAGSSVDRMSVDEAPSPSASVSPHCEFTVRNAANLGLLDVYQDAKAGQAVAIASQYPRIISILKALAAKKDPIPWITKESGPNNSGLVTVGAAPRRGVMPSPDLFLADLFKAENLAVSDSFTNTVDHSVKNYEFLAQIMHIRGGGTVEDGDPVLVAFDIPMTTEGLLKCGFTYEPFEEGRGTVFSPETNCWTPPGAVTFPHIDGFACGMYMVHLAGKKLWLVAPGTANNLRLMEASRTRPGTMEHTLKLIDHLEELHLFYPTKDYKEFAWYLRPGTIHCCLSITECCHSGRPIRTVKWGFLDDIALAYDNAIDWLNNRLVPKEASSAELLEKKLVCVKSISEDLFHWGPVLSGLARGGDKDRLTSIISNAHAGVLQAAKMVGIPANQLRSSGLKLRRM